MNAALVWDPALAEYRFGVGHPMRPERFTRAVDLMRQWDLICAPSADAPATSPQCAPIWQPDPATLDDLLLFHTPELVQAVKAAGTDVRRARARHGLGQGDTPAFPGMHEAANLAVGASLLAVLGVLDGRATRSFSPAGGLHHAHANRAAGFCIYNDPAVAIMRATLDHPGLRVAYIDIDAHHGDGVQEAFYARDDVLTLSVHESGAFLYPGTGHPREIGQGAGRGFALNVPLPPDATDECYELVLQLVVEPALRAFSPDLIFVQGGGDTHLSDPLAHLHLTVAGYTQTIAGIARLADELCAGRLVLTGGGGYEAFSAVPRMWASAMAVLLQREIPRSVPEGWLTQTQADFPAARPGTFDEPEPPLAEDRTRDALKQTERVLEKLLSAHPLLAGR